MSGPWQLAAGQEIVDDQYVVASRQEGLADADRVRFFLSIGIYRCVVLFLRRQEGPLLAGEYDGDVAKGRRCGQGDGNARRLDGDDAVDGGLVEQTGKLTADFEYERRIYLVVQEIVYFQNAVVNDMSILQDPFL